jgi:hypothetical protein
MADASEGFTPFLNLDDRLQSRSKLDWESEQAEVEEVPAYYKRKSAGVWACLATVTVALAVVVIYGYAVLTRINIQLEQIPGMAKSLPAINQHLASFEERLVFSRSDQQKLASQVRRVEAGSKAAIDATRQKTARQVGQVQENLLAEMNQHTAVLQAQVSRLASERDADHQLLVQTEGQLAQARYEIERTRRDNTLKISALREQQGELHRETAFIRNSLPTSKLTFELQKNKAATLAPGISFQLTRTDTRHQRFDGLIESAPDKQAVSVQNQGVRNPIMFYPSDHGNGFLLVITRVDEKEADGYLLIPNGQADQGDSLSATDGNHSPTNVTSWK